jgi:hypothetical protein
MLVMDSSILLCDASSKTPIIKKNIKLNQVAGFRIHISNWLDIFGPYGTRPPSPTLTTGMRRKNETHVGT